MDPERARELLAAERKRIERALPGLGHQDTGEEDVRGRSVQFPPTSTRTSSTKGLADGLRADLAAVERAEARLAAGTYGISVESGEPIPDERLEAIPTAERTVEEEARRNPAS